MNAFPFFVKRSCFTVRIWFDEFPVGNGRESLAHLAVAATEPVAKAESQGDAAPDQAKEDWKQRPGPIRIGRGRLGGRGREGHGAADEQRRSRPVFWLRAFARSLGLVTIALEKVAVEGH